MARWEIRADLRRAHHPSFGRRSRRRPPSTTGRNCRSAWPSSRAVSRGRRQHRGRGEGAQRPGRRRDARDQGCGRGGGVAGGGVALLFASKVLAALNPANNDQKVGIDIVRKAIQSPVRQIAENSGVEGSIVVGKLNDKNDPNFGFDAQSGEYVDMVKGGIIDPTKIVGGAAGCRLGCGAADHHRGDGRRQTGAQGCSRHGWHGRRHGLLSFRLHRRMWKGRRLPEDKRGDSPTLCDLYVRVRQWLEWCKLRHGRGPQKKPYVIRHRKSASMAAGTVVRARIYERAPVRPGSADRSVGGLTAALVLVVRF